MGSVPATSWPGRELSEALGISRGPLREAISRLASEGLLTVVSHRGAFVRTFDAARHENVLLDTSSLIPLGLWLERLVHAVGPSRLLYGTDLYLNPPMFRQNYPLNALREADITDAERTAILHDNAVRVFGLDDLT